MADSDAITEAIEAVEERATAQRPATIPLLVQGHRWTAGNNAEIHAQADDRPSLLVFDPESQAWRAVILPAGTLWLISCIGRPDGLVVPGGRIS